VEEDAGRNRDDLAKTGRGMLKRSTDCNKPEPVLVVPTTLSSSSYEEEESQSKKRWALPSCLEAFMFLTCYGMSYNIWHTFLFWMCMCFSPTSIMEMLRFFLTLQLRNRYGASQCGAKSNTINLILR
jgi:hypothetical protein